jgi:hypothetical protein
MVEIPDFTQLLVFLLKPINLFSSANRNFAYANDFLYFAIPAKGSIGGVFGFDSSSNGDTGYFDSPLFI